MDEGSFNLMEGEYTKSEVGDSAPFAEGAVTLEWPKTERVKKEKRKKEKSPSSYPAHPFQKGERTRKALANSTEGKN
jgi:hypothetical protein